MISSDFTHYDKYVYCLLDEHCVFVLIGQLHGTDDDHMSF